jgi:hypothetical protein
MEEKPVLYYCQLPSGLLDLEHPVCRKSCPSSDNGATLETAPCYSHMEPGVPNPPGAAASGQTFTKENKYFFEDRLDYNTRDLLGVYCVPKNKTLEAAMMGKIMKNPAARAALQASSLATAQSVFMGAAVLAILLGFVYLFFLRFFAKILVFLGLFILSVAPVIGGGILIYNATTEDGLDHIPSTGDSTTDMWIGVGLVIASAIMACISVCACGALRTAIAVVRAASTAMVDMPTLVLEPVITQAIRLGLLAALLYGFGWLLSCGKMTTMTLEEYAVLEDSGAPNVQGVFRTFRYTEEEWHYIFYYVFITIWIMCLMTAASQYAIAYAVQLWYFTAYDDSGRKPGIGLKFSIFTAFCEGFSLHLGSLALGSFLIAVLIAIQLVLGYLAKQAKAEDNKVAVAAAKCMMCCVQCFQRCLEFLNKNAYIDIACNSTSFCFAAKNAFWIIVKNFPEMAILNGACWVFVYVGVGAITSVGTWLVYLIVTKMEYFSDPSKSTYIADPLPILVVTALICGVVSYSFMQVYDMVADTILYCFATEKIRRRRGDLEKDVQYAPADLDELLPAGDREDSQGEDS